MADDKLLRPPVPLSTTNKQTKHMHDKIFVSYRQQAVYLSLSLNPSVRSDLFNNPEAYCHLQNVGTTTDNRVVSLCHHKLPYSCSLEL